MSAAKKKDTGQSKAAPPAAADERNVVEEDLGSTLLPMDEQLRQWWDANQKQMLVLAGVVLAVIAVWQGFRMYRQAYEAGLQETFQTLETDAAKLAFAREHPAHNLGGVAFLDLADQAFGEDDFSTAADYYGNAVDALDPSPIRDRARVGHAMALLKSGKRNDAVNLLEGIAGDTNAANAARAEAAYHRAMLALEDGDPRTFEQYAELIAALPYAQGWTSRLEAFRSEANSLKQ